MRPGGKLIKTFLFFRLRLCRAAIGRIVHRQLRRSRRTPKPPLTLTIMLMAAGTGIIAFAPTYTSIGMGAPLLLLLGTPAARIFRGR